MNRIGSNQNPIIKELRGLSAKSEREALGRLLVEGEKLIREALANSMTPFDAVIDEERCDKFSGLASELEAAGARVFLAPPRAIEAASDTVTPQGVVCSFSMPRALTGEPRAVIALDGVQDPGNFGTIWRTADAAGFGGLLAGEGSADPYSPKTQRAAMGSGFRIGARRGNMPDMLREYKSLGYLVISSALGGDDFSQIAPGKKFILVVGSEARGVSAETLELSDFRVMIPMLGGAESLNAAVAAGILMYKLNAGF